MAEYTRRIYDGVMRIPHELVLQFGSTVTLLSDYRSAVLFRPSANRRLVAKSLELMAETIRNDVTRSRRKMRKRKRRK